MTFAYLYAKASACICIHTLGEMHPYILKKLMTPEARRELPLWLAMRMLAVTSMLGLGTMLVGGARFRSFSTVSTPWLPSSSCAWPSGTTVLRKRSVKVFIHPVFMGFKIPANTGGGKSATRV